jgi:hypothetical protein
METGDTWLEKWIDYFWGTFFFQKEPLGAIPNCRPSTLHVMGQQIGSIKTANRWVPKNKNDGITCTGCSNRNGNGKLVLNRYDAEELWIM